MAPLVERIEQALGGRPMTYHELAVHLFPDRKSWRRQSGGGPPGCYMALSAALRRGGYYVERTGHRGSTRIVHPRNPVPPLWS